ncbi:MAG: glycosyltransferase family 2 protein [Aureliella sp.]|jgi:glycosyltransferase involved in cell wall biosynthesis
MTENDSLESDAEFLQPSPAPYGLSPLSALQTNRLHQVLTDDVCRRLGIFVLPEGFRLSVVIPVFNEVNTVLQVIQRVRRTGLPLEIVLVDDGSQDGTREKLASLPPSDDLRIILHDQNRGKGAALRTGFQHATGDAVVVQDADLEYDPDDFRFLIQPIVEGEADVVYGTRYGHHDRQVAPLWHVFVNRWITRLTNLRTGLYLSDVETCYKVIRRELIAELAPGLRENRFGIEIELTVKLARKRVRFYERPIRYHRRSYHEGKKIGWRDGVRALYCMLRY